MYICLIHYSTGLISVSTAVSKSCAPSSAFSGSRTAKAISTPSGPARREGSSLMYEKDSDVKGPLEERLAVPFINSKIKPFVGFLIFAP